MNIPASIKRIETFTDLMNKSPGATSMNIPASIKRIETDQSAHFRGQHTSMNIPASIKRIETSKRSTRLSLPWGV